MHVVRSLIFSSLLLLSGLVYADGNKALSDCLEAERILNTKEIQNEFAAGFCIGLVQGVRNTMRILEHGLKPELKTCWPPKEINNAQAIRIFVSYLRKNPEHLHEDEVFLAMLAFHMAYPCKGSP
jgi:hypothetical protein